MRVPSPEEVSLHESRDGIQVVARPQAFRCATGSLFTREMRATPEREPAFGVLLAHGWGDHIGDHFRAAKGFCRRGGLCFGLDWPGNGLSAGKRGHMEGIGQGQALLGEAYDVLKARLPTGAPIGLYAHSTGCFLATAWLASKAGPEELAFAWYSSPLVRPGHRQSALKRIAARVVAGLLPELRFDTGVRSNQLYRGGNEEADGMPGALRNRHPKISARMAVDLLRHAGKPLEWASTFAGRDVPWLFTQGDDDPVCPLELTREFFEALAVPRKTLAVLPGFRHEPLQDPERARCLEQVERWLDGLDVVPAMEEKGETAPAALAADSDPGD